MSLRSAVDELVSSLQRSEASLGQLARKFEEESEARYRAGEPNPLQLALRIHKLQKELPELEAACRELLITKQMLLDSTQRLLVGNHTRIKHLSQEAGAQPIDEEKLNDFQSSVGQWNATLRQHIVSGQQMSRQDLDTAIAHITLASNV